MVSQMAPRGFSAPASKDPVASQLEIFQDAVEELPDIEEYVKRTLTNTLNNEARITLAKEDDKTQIAKLLKSQSIPDDKTTAQMPWDKFMETEIKINSKVVESLKAQDFSTKSLKFWNAYYTDVFDKYFVTSRVGKIAIAYNSCSLSLKQRLLALDAGTEARADTYLYLNLLQLLTTVVHSPVSRDQAMLEIYKGLSQTSMESVQVFLHRWRDTAEDAWGPSSGWTMSQASLLLKKICEGFNSTELAKLTASIVVTLPFQWATLCDSIIQFQQRVRSTNPQQNVNAIQQKEVKQPTCYKCSTGHFMRELQSPVLSVLRGTA